MRLPTLTLALCVLAGCDDDDLPDPTPLDAGGDSSTPEPDAGLREIELKFRAQLGEEELVCGQTYAGQGSADSEITPKDFRFYVQSVKLKATTGEEVPLVFDSTGDYQTPDVALIDFTTTGGECDGGPTGSNTSLHGLVPTGLAFNGVQIVIGVPESLNHGNPVTAPAPLQAPGASWDWTAGYRFLIAEVLATSIPDAGMSHGGDHGGGMDAGHSEHGGDDAGDAGHGGHGSAQPGLGFVHLGSTGCTKNGEQFACTNANRAELKLSGFNPERDLIVADLGAVFATANLNGEVQCHGSGPSCGPMFAQLGVDIGAGTPNGMQQVFRVASQR